MDAKDFLEWNKKEELLGVKPSNGSEGCLQDVHWSEGAFGYFPSYLLGHHKAQIFLKWRIIGLIDDLIEMEHMKNNFG